jgi:hypothetical protein
VVETAPQGALVTIDAGAEDEARPAPLTCRLQPGEHVVHVSLAGYQTKTVRFLVTGGSFPHQTVLIELLPVGGRESAGTREERGRRHWSKIGKAGWGLFGGGLAGAMVGGAMSIAAHIKNETLYDKWTDPAYSSLSDSQRQEQYDEDYDSSVQPRRVIAFVLYGLGGAAAISGIVLLALDSRQARRPVLTITPRFGADGAGAALSLTW